MSQRRRLWLSPYELKRRSGARAQGYLLRSQEDDYEFGYADLFPWVEFGDPTWAVIPQILHQPEPPPLIRRALQMAQQDGRARGAGQSLLPEGKRRANHFLIEAVRADSEDRCRQAFAQGFRRFKLKVGRDWQKEKTLLLQLIQLAQEPLLRLDFNGRGAGFPWSELQPFLPWIEFIEDPFVDAEKWQMEGWPFAYDQVDFPWQRVNTNWQVIKPARQGVQDIFAPHWICTSLMDHPVGIAHALAFSLQYGEKEGVDGLMSLLIDEPTEFHAQLEQRGPWLSGRGEPGIGFSDLLVKQNWREVL